MCSPLLRRGKAFTSSIRRAAPAQVRPVRLNATMAPSSVQQFIDELNEGYEKVRSAS